MPEVRRAERRAVGPGRVNLIGDHTDYNQGLALPMAIGLGVTVRFTPSTDGRVSVTSTALGPGPELPLDLPAERAAVGRIEPAWARLTGAMVAVSRPVGGGAVQIDATLPIGAGLSSSAALAVALAEVFGVGGDPEAVAALCQRAEHLAGVPVGALDPLICAGGRRGHALLIDFSTMATRQTPMPEEAEVVVVDSGQQRTLRTSAYAARRAECEAAAAVIGPLGRADTADLARLSGPVLRARARHVVTECLRVRSCAEALATGDLAGAGALMTESHQSLSGDFAVSTPVVDSLAEDLASRPGVLGARMTGAGFGGCVVALCRPGAVDPASLPTPAWRVRPADGTVARRG
ncbi:MAG TPA: galactokinase family protein [Acidimicrobiales bacterium]|nr:galactokinase family protein [Acidimicrobiales bacterium]